MTDTVNQLISYGLHSSSSDWTTTPSLINVRLADNNHLWPKPEYNKISREGVVPDTNDPVVGLRGPKNMVLGDISMEVEGLSAGGAGDGVDSSTLSSTLESAYESVFGAAPQDFDGQITDGVDAGSGTEVNFDLAPSGIASAMLLVKGTTSGLYQARQRRGAATPGPGVEICRPLTTITGAADTALESEDVYASKTWSVNNSVANHKHMAWKVEHVGGFEGTFDGCFPSAASWSMAVGDILKFNMGGMTATQWSKQDAAGGSYVAPTTGDKVVCTPLYFYIGNDLYMASEVNIDLGIQVAPRPANQTDANMFGHVVVRVVPTITATIMYGDITAPQEATNTLIDTWQGANANSSYTADVLVQAGDRPGGCAAWVAPAAEFVNVERTESNGMEAVNITMRATESSNANASATFYHAIF